MEFSAVNSNDSDMLGKRGCLETRPSKYGARATRCAVTGMDASPKITVGPRSSPFSFSQPCHAALLYSSSLSLSVVQVASRVLVTAAADASVCLTLSHPLPPLPLSANGCYTAVTIIYFVTACLCKEFPSHQRLLLVGARKHISSKSNFPNWQNFPFLARRL